MTSVIDEILYQNEAKDITIIDLPTSIVLAQTLPGNLLVDYALYSPEPLQEPHKSIEPRSLSARANVLSRLGQDGNADHDPTSHLVIRESLDKIRENYQGDWCLPRQLSPLAEQRKGKKRKFDDVDVVIQKEPELLELQQWERFGRKFAPQSSSVLNLSATSDRYILSGYQALSHRVICNPQSEEVLLVTPDPKAEYRIPPLSRFYLGGIDNQTVKWFSQSVFKIYSTPSSSAGLGQFEFILLDPPWQNRSVTRSQRYKTAKGSNPLFAVQGILSKHIAPEGIVACWITNNASARMAALKAFEDWNVYLIEQWIWLKTTAQGEPVYDMEGLWRKPYETLLVGRKSDKPMNYSTSEINRQREVKYRFLGAVPDLHSRKPCLRSLIAPLMQNAQDYRALEIFARNLTAGWWAWGDEVLKFNWQGHWKKVRDHEKKTKGEPSTSELAKKDEIKVILNEDTLEEESIGESFEGPPPKIAKIEESTGNIFDQSAT
ncbi:hypothetical protein MMC14_003731 [Varicellaria rhodocarpa]|nr:hypothetical protein [Varicellaria rhodocarpa]